jgi:hypothetical protein
MRRSGTREPARASRCGDASCRDRGGSGRRAAHAAGLGKHQRLPVVAFGVLALATLQRSRGRLPSRPLSAVGFFMLGR